MRTLHHDHHNMPFYSPARSLSVSTSALRDTAHRERHDRVESRDARTLSHSERRTYRRTSMRSSG